VAAKKHISSGIPDDYAPLKGSERRPASDSKLLGPADANETFKVTIVLRRRPDGPAIPSFDYFAKTPLSQRRKISREEFALKYGAAPDDMKQVADFARSHGLTIIETHTARRTVVVSGTAAQMSKAFAIDLARYERVTTHRHGKKTIPRKENYRGYEGAIHVPQNIADLIVGVFGLDTRSVTRPHGLPGDPPITNELSMQQVTQLYNFPSPGAAIAGQTIGVIAPTGGYGGYLQSDLNLYFGPLGMGSFQPIPISTDGVVNGTLQASTTQAQTVGDTSLTFGLTQGILQYSVVSLPTIGLWYFAQVGSVASTATSTTVTLVNWDQATQQFVPQALTAAVPMGTPVCFNLDQETTQDICITGAMSSGANIAVYFGEGTEPGWVDLVNRAIHPNPGDPVCSVLSCSWTFDGGDDASGFAVTSGAVQALHGVFQDAALFAVTYCSASGDSGTDLGTGAARVAYPTTDPFVLAVGGTTIGQYQPTGSANPAWVEFLWNDTFFGGEIGATGGGVSDFFTDASGYGPEYGYQKIANIPAVSINDGHVGRGIPDVAGNASPNSGYPIFLAGAPADANGTSASTPTWAALVALINSNLGYSVGFINPFIYALGSSAFNPISPLWPDPSLSQLATCPANNSLGGIAGYTAGAGWDACTGWGSPNGIALLQAYQQQLAQDCYFIVDQPIFGEGAVAAELLEASAATFDLAFFLVVDELTPNQLGISPATVADPVANPPATPPVIAPQANGLSFVLVSVQPADPTLLASSPNAPQRFTLGYDLVFSSTSAFPAQPDQVISLTITATVNATVNGNPQSVSSSATLQLNSDADPYFAGGSGISWLSDDLRVFQVEPGEWLIQDPPYSPISTGFVLGNTGNPSNDATQFIRDVIDNFNINRSSPTQLFDFISTDENQSALDLLQFDPNNNSAPVYNFAIARVRYDDTTQDAQAVRVFFRLIPALSTSVGYDQTTNYRRWSDGNEFGQSISLWGADPTSTGDVFSIPCFGDARNVASAASLDAQTDALNVQNIPAATAGNSTYTYFGCWLDLNQPNLPAYPMNPGANLDGPFPAASLQPISTLLQGLHQCLVAEIAFDPDPIPQGYSPSTSGPLAQRNLSLLPAANPGEIGSRRVPNTFTVRPTSPTLANGEQSDEVMIDWGDVPTGSVASIYWPEVSAAQVLRMAALMYTTHSLTMSDAHTLNTPTGGITYIPIPPGSGATFVGLISVDLPHGIRDGQSFNIVVRQVTNASLEKDKDNDRRPGNWRRVLGSFQIAIAVKTKAVMLAPEERSLALMKWILEKTPPSSRWFPVFRRYVAQIAQRVGGLGGNPNAVAASPAGNGNQPIKPVVKPCHHKADGAALESIGKVAGLKYDSFGDFEGFLLRTAQGDERSFRCREHELEELIDRAWAERILISVFANPDHPHIPASIVLRNA